MTNSVKTAKQALRKELRLRISSLSDAEKQKQSDYVAQTLFSRHEFRQCNSVSLFLSMPDEVQTNSILQHLLNTKRKCFIPQYHGNAMKMVRLFSYDDYLTLPRTSWNIPQPAIDEQREEAIETGGVDLILMPGLGFTRGGKRLGRGKGYYDSYLTKYEQVLKKKPCTIALAYYEQICDDIPTTERDVLMDVVLFEDKSSINDA